MFNQARHVPNMYIKPSFPHLLHIGLSSNRMLLEHKTYVAQETNLISRLVHNNIHTEISG